jgi:hypothetical protein
MSIEHSSRRCNLERGLGCFLDQCVYFVIIVVRSRHAKHESGKLSLQIYTSITHTAQHPLPLFELRNNHPFFSTNVTVVATVTKPSDRGLVHARADAYHLALSAWPFFAIVHLRGRVEENGVQGDGGGG